MTNSSPPSIDRETERKLRFYLLLGGSVLGILIGCVVGYVVHRHRQAAALAGSQFENLNDLRRAMLGHDERDELPGDNVSLRTLVQPDDSDFIIYRLRPNLSVKFHDVEVRTNSHGMRGPEIPVEKPPGAFRIALLGDSFAFGWGVEEDKTFARVIERELNARLPKGPRVEVMNFAAPGYSTFQEVAVFQQYAAPFRPDAALVYFVDNDFGLPFFIKDLENPGELARDSDFAELKAKQADTEHDEKNQALLKSLDPNRALLRLDEFADSRGIRAFLTINPSQSAHKMEGRLWGLRGAKHLAFLSIRDEVRQEITAKGYTPDQLRLPTDPHPSALKHDILGKVLAERLYAQLFSQPLPGQ